MVTAGGVGELQKMHLEVVSMSWTVPKGLLTGRERGRKGLEEAGRVDERSEGAQRAFYNPALNSRKEEKTQLAVEKGE